MHNTDQVLYLSDSWKFPVIVEFMFCRMSLRCSALYLAQFRFTSSHILATGDGIKSATITGDVYIHPSAKVHPTAKVMMLKFWRFFD